MKRPIKLFVADVDGTLITPDHRLTPRTCAAVERLRKAGVRFGITSSRPPRGMAMLVAPLGLEDPIAAFNGGMFVQPDVTRVLEEHTLPSSVAREVVDYILACRLDCWVYRGTDWFIRNADAPHVAHEQSTVQFGPAVVSDLADVLEGAVKIVGVSDDFALVARCEAGLRDRIGAHATASRSQRYYVDVTHPDANKGMVVRHMASFLGIPLEQTATIGDMPNDVLMFAVSGTSIAMGNASCDVQRTARYVTTANTDEGFANAVDRFIFG